MSETPKIAYVTRYALSDGITARRVIEDQGNGYLCLEWPGAVNGWNIVGPSEWAINPGAAMKTAEDMRTRKIALLKKQIAKLEKLTFSVPDAPVVLTKPAEG